MELKEGPYREFTSVIEHFLCPRVSQGLLRLPNALPWEREARLQLASESSSLTALVILFLHELHLHHDTFGSSSVNRSCRSAVRGGMVTSIRSTPSSHIENLKRYLLIALSLAPRDPALGHFYIRHPDLQQGNIVVRRSSGKSSACSTGNTPPSCPCFCLPVHQRAHCPVRQSITPPSLPENINEKPNGLQRRKSPCPLLLRHKRGGVQQVP